MIERIAVLSGHVCSGKTTLSKSLEDYFNEIFIFKTKDYIQYKKPTVERERGVMQDYGEYLDRKTRGVWVREGLDKFIENENLRDHSTKSIIIIDAVRIPQQIKEIRKSYGHKVIHIHLDTPMDELHRRYKKRKEEGIKEFSSYDQVMENPTEKKVDNLKKIADAVINTKLCTIKDVMIKAASHLALYGREYHRLVDVLVGGQYGSEGKGNIVAYLANEYDYLLRVGGPNAGHSVYSEPKKLVFHHLPSGCRRNQNAKLIIGPGATIYIPRLLEEISNNEVEAERLYIDPQAMIITDEDRENEKKLTKKIGSTGQGVGFATARKILNRFPNKTKLAGNHSKLKPYLKPTCEVLNEAFTNKKKILLEGTQGTELSLYHGHYPYVTSRDTTVAGCLSEAGISPSRTRKVIMVCRTYPIRVESPLKGTSGPMDQEIEWNTVEERAKLPKGELSKNEHTSTTHKKRRVGEFEWYSLFKAALLNAPTDIALTFVDYISKENLKARRFEQLTNDTIRFIEEVENVTLAPVSLISTRFEFRNIIDRRTW